MKTALIALATFMPQGIAAPFGGVLADRFDRRKLFACALVGQACATAALALLIAVGVRSPLVLAVLIMCSSVAGAFGAPAYAAMVPDLVPPDELMAMLGLAIYSWNFGRIIGPIAGAMLASTLGPALTVAINATSFAVLAIAVSLIRRAFPPHDVADEPIIDRLSHGWKVTRSIRACGFGIIGIVAMNLSIGPFMAMLPAFAEYEFNGGTRLAGLFSATQGVGAIVGTLSATALAARFGLPWVVSRLCVFATISYFCFALAPTVPLALLGVFGLGAALASLFTSLMAMVQRQAPDAERGRVLSIMHGATGFSYGLGTIWLGTVGDLFDIRTAYAIAATVLIVELIALKRRFPDWGSLFTSATRERELVDA